MLNRCRVVAALCALVMVLLVFSAVLADGGIWYCPECGEMNTGNFCPYDGTRRPEMKPHTPTPTPTRRPYVTPKPAATAKPVVTPRPVSVPAVDFSSLRVHDKVRFGTYPQGAKGERKSVEWVVLARQGTELLLLADQALDTQKFNSERANVSWTGSTLYSWLNGEFLRNCFSTAEQSALKTHNGIGRVFCLSEDEYKRYVDEVLDSEGHHTLRKAIPTSYAVNRRKVKLGDAQGKGTEYCYWWLRDCLSKNSVRCVNPRGGIYSGNMNTNADGVGVRPAIWVRADYNTYGNSGSHNGSSSNYGSNNGSNYGSNSGTGYSGLWPRWPYQGRSASFVPQDKRYQSYTGPAYTYHGGGAFLGEKVESLKVLFVEKSMAYVELDYTSVGLRRLYFPKKLLTSVKGVPTVNLVGYSAVTTRPVKPFFGPGPQYDDYQEAQILSGVSLQVFYEENGWVFAEFNTGSDQGTVRAWMPVNAIKRAN